jgi:ABC-type sugar transport system ATPase subunit
MENSEIMLQVEGISKAFPGVQALAEVTMDVRQGEILALVGENGAGKSTLIKVLSGVYKPDKGRILIEGQEVTFRNPLESVQAGVSVVYQELSLVPNLNVAENMYGGRPPANHLGLMDTVAMKQKTDEMLSPYHVEFGARTSVGKLSLGNQQLVEIVKALSANAKILILDEPTSSLSLQEAKILFERLRQMKAQGIAIIYVSHHLEEVFEISDWVVVICDGRYVGTRQTSQTNEREIVSMMVGRDLDATGGLGGDLKPGDEILRVEHLSCKGSFEDVSFTLHKQEVLTFFGLVGAGRTEVAHALMGLKPLIAGKIFIDRKPVNISHPAVAKRYGMVYLSEDRKSEGLFLDKTIKENFLATNLKQVSPSGWVNWGILQRLVQEFVDRLEIRTPSLDQKINNLSGGNQQKVLIGEWLATEPSVLIVDEPTRGIDVGTKQEIHRLLRALAGNKKGVLVISSDLPEALRISDRIAVMRKGRIVAILDHSEANESRVMELAAGVNSKEVNAS